MMSDALEPIFMSALLYDDSTWIFPIQHDTIHAFTGVLDYGKASRYRHRDAANSFLTPTSWIIPYTLANPNFQCPIP